MNKNAKIINKRVAHCWMILGYNKIDAWDITIDKTPLPIDDERLIAELGMSVVDFIDPARKDNQI